jgi:hypothetical protein
VRSLGEVYDEGGDAREFVKEFVRFHKEDDSQSQKHWQDTVEFILRRGRPFRGRTGATRQAEEVAMRLLRSTLVVDGRCPWCLGRRLPRRRVG